MRQARELAATPGSDACLGAAILAIAELESIDCENTTIEGQYPSGGDFPIVWVPRGEVGYRWELTSWGWPGSILERDILGGALVQHQVETKYHWYAGPFVVLTAACAFAGTILFVVRARRRRVILILSILVIPWLVVQVLVRHQETVLEPTSWVAIDNAIDGGWLVLSLDEIRELTANGADSAIARAIVDALPADATESDPICIEGGPRFSLTGDSRTVYSALALPHERWLPRRALTFVESTRWDDSAKPVPLDYTETDHFVRWTPPRLSIITPDPTTPNKRHIVVIDVSAVSTLLVRLLVAFFLTRLAVNMYLAGKIKRRKAARQCRRCGYSLIGVE